MSKHHHKPIGIFYEHHSWFKPLFEELESRRIPFVRINAAQHLYNPSESEPPYSLVVNRMSSSAYLRGNVQGIFHAANYLDHLERLGVPTINGAAAQRVESSKAKQLSLLTGLGIPFPRTRVVNHLSQVLPAAKTLKFPIVVKANIGGGVRFDTERELQKAIDLLQINLGADHTALVQEYVAPAERHFVRIETLNGKFLYAIKISIPGVTPAEGYSPPRELIDTAERIFQTAGIDAGSVDYLVDIHGQVHFYDIRALSHFIADAVHILGFDPYKKFVDYIELRLQHAHDPYQPAYALKAS